MTHNFSWEMSTIGHPLSDLSNLLLPFSFAADPREIVSRILVNPAFVPGNWPPGLPSQEQCSQCYAEMVDWDPSSDLAWGCIFAMLRNGVIMQGIAARFARRQASSEKAREIGGLMEPYGKICWRQVERWKLGHQPVRTAKL